MTNKLIFIINSLKVPKIKKNILLYEMKFLLPNYSCLQNPWLGGCCPHSVCPLSSTEFVEHPPQTKFLGMPLPPKHDWQVLHGFTLKVSWDSFSQSCTTYWARKSSCKLVTKKFNTSQNLNSSATFCKISTNIEVIKKKRYRFEFLWFSS